MECGEIPPGARSRTYGGHVTRVRACVHVRAYGETGKWECGLLRGADIQEEGHLGLWESDLLEPPLERVGVMRKDELWPNNPS